MAASDATAIPIKNQAYRVSFPILDADGDLVTGAAGLDSEVSKDGGTFADVTAEATEIATASGMYYLDLTATEMNADTVALIVKTTTTGAKTTPIVLYPAESTDIPVNVTAIGGVVQSATDLKDFADTGYDPSAHRTQAQIKATDDIDLSATQKTSVNAQVVDVMKTDTTAEMSQGAPPATPTFEEMFAYIYFMFRNKNIETSTEHSVYDNAGTTKLFKAAMADTTGTLTKDEFVSGA